MRLDSQAIFSDTQKITTSAASTNVVKMASTDNGLTEVAAGNPIPLLVQVVEDFAGATSVSVDVQTSADEAFTSPKTLASSGDIVLADLKAGYQFPINYIPKGNLGYMRLYYNVNGSSGAGTATAGAITAGIVDAIDTSYHDI